MSRIPSAQFDGNSSNNRGIILRQSPIPASRAWQFSDFHDWLVKQGKTPKTVKETVNFAKRFAAVLDTGDASMILDEIKPQSWHHVLSALANLAKYTGRYKEFNDIRRNYNLKWVKPDASKNLESVLNPSLDLDSMIGKVRKMIAVLPPLMGQIVKLDVLTGLRPGEVVECARLLADRDTYQAYYNEERQCLEHYRFPKIFLRQTKKCYLSFITADMLEQTLSPLGEKVPSHNAISKMCQRRGITCDLRYCRKIHATYLHKEGIPTEIIDAVQGRTPVSIFARHYYRPSLDYKDKILCATIKLMREIAV